MVPKRFKNISFFYYYKELAKKIIENNKQDNDLKLLEEVNNEPYNNQFLENTPDISIKGRGKYSKILNSILVKIFKTYKLYTISNNI